MGRNETDELVRNLDRRVGHIEQILPTLVTKQDLDAAIAPLATKAELAVTKTELRAEIREEGERSRRHMEVLVEHLEAKIDLYAEKVVATGEALERAGGAPGC